MQRAKTTTAVAATLLAGVGLLTGGNPAFASGTESARNAPRSTTVRYGDLDLTRSAGVEVLYSRLRSAARQVCGSAGGRNVRAVKECYRGALDRAVIGMDLPALAALHQRSGWRRPESSAANAGRYSWPLVHRYNAGSAPRPGAQPAFSRQCLTPQTYRA